MNFKGKIKAVLFDVDGTLFSSEGIIKEVYEEEFTRLRRETGKPEHVPEREEIMAQIGKPVREIFRNLVPDLEETLSLRLNQGILENLVRRIDSGEGEHYRGAFTTVSRLHAAGYRLFTASNGRLPYIQAVLRANRTLDFFEDVSAVDYQRIHNKIELVATTLADHGLSPDEALVVGDRRSDRDAAIENGCPFAGCLFGHGNRDELEGASIWLDDLAELVGYL